jgi:Putative zinc-finger
VAAMDHGRIEDEQWIGRYAAGTLPGEQADVLEQHLLLCRACRERLELEETLRDGVRAWSVEQAARQQMVRAGLPGWLSRRGRSRALALAWALLLLVALMPGGLLLREVQDLRRELARTRAAASGPPAASPGAGVPSQGAVAGEGARRIEQLQGQLAAERLAADRAAAGERREHAGREQLAQQLEAERQPRIDTPIVTLSPLRSADQGGGAAPVMRVALPPRQPAGAARPTAWIALALELDGPRRASYAVTLAKAGGETVWSGQGLHLDAADQLTLSLPAPLLAPGDYELRVDGQVTGSPPVPVARFAFRAVAAR